MVAKLDKLTYHTTSLTYLPTYQSFYQEVGSTSTKEEGRSGGFLALFGLVLTLPKIPFPAGGKAVRLCPRGRRNLGFGAPYLISGKAFFPAPPLPTTYRRTGRGNGGGRERERKRNYRRMGRGNGGRQ